MIVLDVSVICKIQHQASAYGMSGSYSGSQADPSSANQNRAFSPHDQVQPIRGQGSGQLTVWANGRGH